MVSYGIFYCVNNWFFKQTYFCMFLSEKTSTLLAHTLLAKHEPDGSFRTNIHAGEKRAKADKTHTKPDKNVHCAH